MEARGSGGGKWEQRLSQNFDNVWNSMLTLTEISTTEGWVDVMYAANLAKYTQAPGLRELLVSARGRIRAKGAQDMWATWNEVLLERIREELREGPDRDAIVLAERVAMMAAYQAAARGLPGEHAERAVTAITRQAAKRELQPAVLGGGAAASSLSIAGCSLAGAGWVNDEYMIDPLQPLVNGQPHYMTNSGSGHLYVGAKNGQAKWVVDEQFDANETGGALTLTPPGVPSEALAFPSGVRSWEVYGGAPIELRITKRGAA